MISDSRAGSWGVRTIKAVNRAGQPHRFSRTSSQVQNGMIVRRIPLSSVVFRVISQRLRRASVAILACWT